MKDLKNRLVKAPQFKTKTKYLRAIKITETDEYYVDGRAVVLTEGKWVVITEDKRIQIMEENQFKTKYEPTDTDGFVEMNKRRQKPCRKYSIKLWTNQ